MNQETFNRSALSVLMLNLKPNHDAAGHGHGDQRPGAN
jgi:hypothetical protein